MNPPKSVRRKRRIGRFLSFGLLTTFCFLIVFAAMQKGREPAPEASVSAKPEVPIRLASFESSPAVPEQLPEDLQPRQAVDPVIPEPVLSITEGTIKSGDTAASLLCDHLTSSEIHFLSQECKDIFPLSRIKAGNVFRLTTKDDLFHMFEYEISPDEKLIIERDDQGSFTAFKENILYDVEKKIVIGQITDNLFNAVSTAGERPELAMILADIFAWDVDFCRDIRAGDSFKAYVEKRYRNGEFAGYGKVLAAEFVNQGDVFQGFRFDDGNGRASFYGPDGKSLRKIFLKAPLSFRRISSGYSYSRMHPILKYRRPHLGIDYAAPTGTPIWTVGDGVVLAKGYNKAAGNYVRIRHNSIYETQYNHLSRFARGLRKGKSYKQGDVIGYVGSTGYSTGPHLDYRMYKYGKNINPRNIKFPSADPVPEQRMAAFREHIKPLRALLEQQDGTAVAEAEKKLLEAASRTMN